MDTPSRSDTTPSRSPSPASDICFRKPRAIYDGGYKNAKSQGVRLRIGSGSAGQTGVIHAWADAFIQYMVSKGTLPFEVAWYLTDTTEGLLLLSSGSLDAVVTYCPASEKRILELGDAVDRVHGYNDHFVLVGPTSNPAGLEEKDDVFAMFNKIVTWGDADLATPPDTTVRPATRFLSRYDRSATNIKESEIFIRIGQVPWAHSKWYHRYQCYPSEALHAAAMLNEYTLTDVGTLVSQPKSIVARLKAFKYGNDEPNNMLTNPAHVLLGKRASPENHMIHREFMSWVGSPTGGQKIIEKFSHMKLTKAPRSRSL